MKYKFVVVGASAGGIGALQKLISVIPDSFPLPVICVLHFPPGASVDWDLLFGSYTHKKIREVSDKLPLETGFYFAPPDYHVSVEANMTLALSQDPEINYSRPSIDALFKPAAYFFKDQVIGILLTGAGSDGAAGMKDIAIAKGITIVQDPRSAEVPAMPQSALEIMKPDFVVPIEEMGKTLVQILERGSL